jgi:ABC-2 type transport system permease protein
LALLPELLGQAIAVGGLMIFSLIETWIFGREFADGTLKDLLAVPVLARAILLAKFILFALWSGTDRAGLSRRLVFGGLLGAALGSTGYPPRQLYCFGHGLPGDPGDHPCRLARQRGAATFADGDHPCCWRAGQSDRHLRLGSYFWAVPGVYAGLAGQPTASYWIVLLTGLAGIFGTHLWWKYADQSR